MLFKSIFPWVLLHVISFAFAEKHIKTNSLLTCMQDSQFSATYFEVVFYPDNSTAVFSVNAETTISEKIIAKAELIVYGLNVLNEEIDLCDLDEASVCPLNSGRIDLTSTFTISSSVTDQIPSIAYTIPDLDAQVRVIAYSQNDTTFSTPLACVQASLSNGKTVQTKYASWPIAAISGLGLLTSAVVSVIGHSTTAAHIASNSISLFVYFQNLAITAMMAVSRVPPIASAWSQNFQWSMGMISVPFMQDIFNWYVKATGGSPVVVLSNKDILSISVQKKKRSFTEEFVSETLPDAGMRLFKRVSLDEDYDFSSIFADTDLYTTDERNTTEISTKVLILRGIKRVAYLANIELSNVFLTGIVFFLFFIFCMIILMALFKAGIELAFRAGYMKETSKFYEYRRSWSLIIKGTLFRICIIAFPQVALLSIWEFTQVDSAAVVVDAVFIFLVISGLLLYGTIRVVIRGRESVHLYKNPAYLLYGDAQFLNRFGFLYVQFLADMYWWLLPLLAYLFLRSLFVAVLQQNGKPQAVIIFVIEVLYLAFLCWKRPYLDKRTNAFNIAIHVVNFINALFFLFFSNIFKQPAVVSSVMAVIYFVLNAIFALFLLIFTIVTCTLVLIRKNPDARYQQMKDDRVSFIPKIQSKSDSGELFDLGQTVMRTNEISDQKMQPNEFEMKNGNGSSRLLFEDELDESTSTYESSSHLKKQDISTTEPLKMGSAVLGDGSQSSYSRIPTAPNTNLKKPENTFSTNTQYQGFTGSNPYLDESAYGKRSRGD